MIATASHNGFGPALPAAPQATVPSPRPPSGRAVSAGHTGAVRALPEHVGPYRVLRQLGRGGQGVVYLAHDPRYGRLVALKQPTAPPADTDARAQFAREVELAARLSHPGIVAIYDAGTDAGLPYLAMELITGPTLAERLAPREPLDPHAAARLVLAVTRAVRHTHARNIVHRDLKPANLLLDEQGEPHVADFGLARRLDGPSAWHHGSGAVLGTPAYMSPEQAAGFAHLAGPAADIWAIGAILYECLAGVPAFRGDTAQEVLHQVGAAAPPPLPGRAVPRALEALCLRCLQKDPARRYPSAAALAADLEGFLSGDSVSRCEWEAPAPRLQVWERRLTASPQGFRSDETLPHLPGVRFRFRMPGGASLSGRAA